MKFNILDLDKQALVEKSRVEAENIFRHKSHRDNRSLQEIRMARLYVIAAEQYLIESRGFRNDPSKHKHVLSPLGVSVEIKVTTEEKIGLKLRQCDMEHGQKYRNYSNWVFIFESVWSSGIYHLYGTYAWAGGGFSRRPFNWKEEAEIADDISKEEAFFQNPNYNRI